VEGGITFVVTGEKMRTKPLLGLMIMLTVAAVASADTIVQVVLNPVSLFPLSDASREIPLPGGGHTYDFSTESIGASFTWDVTTNVVYDAVAVATGGPYFQEMTTVGGSPNFVLNFSNSAGDLFQMNSGNHGGAIPALTGTVGTFATDLFVSCAQCISANEQFVGGTATVTAVDPVSTPEPGTVALLVAPLGLLIFWRTRVTKLSARLGST
jgi:hypothetical protein